MKQCCIGTGRKGGNKRLRLLVIWYVDVYSVMVMFTSDKYGNNETDTKCLPSNKKCPGYTGDRMPNEQNYKEEGNSHCLLRGNS